MFCEKNLHYHFNSPRAKLALPLLLLLFFMQVKKQYLRPTALTRFLPCTLKLGSVLNKTPRLDWIKGQIFELGHPCGPGNTGNHARQSENASYFHR